MSGTRSENGTRTCPHCGSQDTDLIQRGYAGATDASDQYFACRSCGELTYEIISRTRREVRIERLEPGRRFRHEGTEYIVSRVLRVGLDELLVYVQPYSVSARSR